MKLLDVADRVEIDPRKLTHYVLDTESPYGRHKAILFARILGFTKDNYALLLRQLETRALESDITLHSEDEFGKRYTADLLIEGVENKRATVRTGWLVSKTRTAYLVTLYVRRK